MLHVSRLLNGTHASATASKSAETPAHSTGELKPVVIWSITRRCNLSCLHCDSSSQDREYPNELTTAEGRALIEDLAVFGVPVVLFSGGEPLMRDDLFDFAGHARGFGMSCVLSTNGTFIDAGVARRIADARFSYVGISFDGAPAVHDRIRGKRGAYDAALNGLRLLHRLGVPVEVRFTLHRKNADQLPAVFDLLEEEGVERCCIHHLAYSGRGELLQATDLAPQERRAAVEYIFDRAEDFDRRGIEKDIVTDDNTADAILLLKRVRDHRPRRLREVWQRLTWYGGNQSGAAVASVDPAGGVHVDQFSWHYALGNVRHRRFSEIWADNAEPRLAELRRDPRRIKGRCSGCRFLGLCNGNLRARAESYFGDFLAPDPACYLTDSEIGIAPGTPEALAAAEWPVPVQAAASTSHR